MVAIQMTCGIDRIDFGRRGPCALCVLRHGEMDQRDVETGKGDEQWADSSAWG